MSTGGFSTGEALQYGSGMVSGFVGFFTGMQTATLMEEEGALSKGDYFRQAMLVRDEGRRFRAKQTMGYISSGVEIAGTPQLVLKETYVKYRAKAGALETTGINMQNLYDKKADIQREESYGQLIQGIMSAAALGLTFI